VLHTIGSEKMLARVLAAIITLAAATSAQAVERGVPQRPTRSIGVIDICNRADICINGIIGEGAAARFERLTRNYPPGTIVWLSGPGGRVGEMLDIGDLIQRRGFTTAVSQLTRYCASACALLFLSGNHAIIERDSLLIFHEGKHDDGSELSSEEYAYLVDRMAPWGIERWQAEALLHAAPNVGGRPGTEAWARALGFDFHYIYKAFGLWRNCAYKFCVAI